MKAMVFTRYGSPKEYGCEVTGVDGAHKLDALKALGFDHVLDYRQVDFTRNRRRYDLILDAKTTRSPFRYLDALEPGGRYVTVGGHLSRLLQTFLLGPGMEKWTGKSLRVLALKPNAGLDRISSMFESNPLECLIDGPYPLDDVPKALARFGKGGHIGKMVITVA